jgi:hypothetical protein
MELKPIARYVLVAIGALSIAFGIPGFYKFKRYVDEDPRLCATCHRSNAEFALWLGGSHKSVACQKCHHSSSAQVVAMLQSYVAGKTPGGRHADVEVGACASCHFSHDPRWPQVGGSRGHKLHYEERKIACIRCHAASMHGFAPMAEKCAECHPSHAVNVAGMQQFHCFACHEFMTNEPGLRPTRADCMRCHTAKGIHAPVADHGVPMGLACSACHKPHAPEGQSLAPCKECHPLIARGALHDRPGHARCLACHKPHMWKVEDEACMGCHDELPGVHTMAKGCRGCHRFGGVSRPPPGTVPVVVPTKLGPAANQPAKAQRR